MKVEMLMPQLGESISEATVLKWRKSVGETVERDETVVEISTDKVDSEIPSPESGRIVQLLVKEGETVPIKTPILIIETDVGAGAVSESGSGAKPDVSVAKSTKEGDAPKPEAKPEAKAKVEAAPAKLPIEDTTAKNVGQSPVYDLSLLDGAKYTPLVRMLAAQYQLSASDLSEIYGSGPQGKVTKSDLLEFLVQRGVQTDAPGVLSKAPKEEKVVRPQYDESGIRREPMDRMRQIIAEHMVRSKATSPHVYTIAEVDVTAIAEWRAKRQQEFLSREGFKLSFTPFFLEAVTKSLVKFSRINASVDGTDLVMKRDINLGCAVALGNTGLIVPVIKQADELNLVGLARALNDLAERARQKSLSPNDIQGGTFTVTNIGTFGNIMGCPIINQPQLGILGIGAIKKRPMVVNNMIAIREMCYLTLSYDHRVIDGSLAGQFMQNITKYLEGWNLDRTL